MPPAAWRVCEYAVPTTPFARDVVVTVSTGGAIVRLKLALAVCADEPESVTLNVSGVAVMGVLGVPLINPVDAFSDNPAGKVPAVTCRSEEHTSELQSLRHLVCRLLLEK